VTLRLCSCCSSGSSKVFRSDRSSEMFRIQKVLIIEFRNSSRIEMPYLAAI